MNTEMNTTENTENIEKLPQVAKTTNENTQPTYKHNLRAFYNLFLENPSFCQEKCAVNGSDVCFFEFVR